MSIMSSSLPQSTGWTALFFTTQKAERTYPRLYYVAEDVRLEIARKLIGAGANVLLRDQVHHTLTLCSVECVCVCVCVCVSVCV